MTTIKNIIKFVEQNPKTSIVYANKKHRPTLTELSKKGKHVEHGFDNPGCAAFIIYVGKYPLGYIHYRKHYEGIVIDENNYKKDINELILQLSQNGYTYFNGYLCDLSNS